MSILSMLGLNEAELMSNSDKAKKSFLSIMGKLKPHMDKRGIKSIIVFVDKDGKLDMDMLDYSMKDREQELINHISLLNNKLLKK